MSNASITNGKVKWQYAYMFKEGFKNICYAENMALLSYIIATIQLWYDSLTVQNSR
jgi:hypothetical protein